MKLCRALLMFPRVQAPGDEYEYYDYSAIWSDYPDQDQETGDSDASDAVTPTQTRINFAKYGRHNASEDAAAGAGAGAVSAALPDNIYCDLVTTLSAKCIQERSAALHRHIHSTF